MGLCRKNKELQFTTCGLMATHTSPKKQSRGNSCYREEEAGRRKSTTALPVSLCRNESFPYRCPQLQFKWGFSPLIYTKASILVLWVFWGEDSKNLRVKCVLSSRWVFLEVPVTNSKTICMERRAVEKQSMPMKMEVTVDTYVWLLFPSV